MAMDIPPDFILEARARAARGEQTRAAMQAGSEAAVAAMERGDEEGSYAAMSGALRAASIAFLDWLAGQTPLDRRLHLLVWILEAPTPDSAAAFVIEGGPERAEAILAAIAEAGLAESAARFEAIVAAARDFETTPDEGPERDRLDDLSFAFDAPGAYRDDLRAALTKDREMAARVAAMRAGLDEQDRLDIAAALVGEKVGERDGVDALQGLDEGQRLVWLVLGFDHEVGDGGLSQFFAHEPGDCAPETAAALRLIGCGEAARVLLRAVAAFPAPYPRDADERFDRLEADGGRLGERIDALTDEIDLDAVRPALIDRLKRLGALPR